MRAFNAIISKVADADQSGLYIPRPGTVACERLGTAPGWFGGTGADRVRRTAIYNSGHLVATARAWQSGHSSVRSEHRLARSSDRRLFQPQNIGVCGWSPNSAVGLNVTSKM